jgi:hypothetical protein
MSRALRQLEPNRKIMVGDPPDFADTCLLLFTVHIGNSEFPVDVAALDRWIAKHGTAEARAGYQRKRSLATSAFRANDVAAVGHALEDLHQFVHMLRALPKAHLGAKSSKAQSDRAKVPHKLDQKQKQRIKDQYDARVAEGRQYGAIKELARRYGVSESSIKRAIK